MIKHRNSQFNKIAETIDHLPVATVHIIELVIPLEIQLHSLLFVLHRLPRFLPPILHYQPFYLIKIIISLFIFINLVKVNIFFIFTFTKFININKLIIILIK